MNTQTAILMLGLATLARVAPGTVAHTVHHASPTDSTTNTVTVQNDRKSRVTVYLENGVFDRRLGVVPSLATATLALPKWMVQGRETVQLFAHPEGEAVDLATQEFPLQPPGQVALLIPPQGGFPEARTDTMSAVIPPEELADATITVDNPRKVPVTVFAEQGEFDSRIGQVAAKSRATLRFPKSALVNGSIRLFVHPEGGDDLASQTLTVKKGQHLGLRVPLGNPL